MEIDAVLPVAIICIIIGFLMGLLIASFKDKPASEKLDKQRELLLKVWRKHRSQDIIVEINGHEYGRSSDLDTKQQNQMNRIVLAINTWLGTSPYNKSETVSPVVPNEPFLEQLTPEKVKPRLNLNPVNILSNALRADVSKNKIPPESIVTQVDTILQEKLNDSPFRGEPIRLMEWPGKGMVVMVGLEQYDSVDDVPNELIKILIRSAVKEWEQRGIDHH